MPETMLWKQVLMCLAVILVINTWTSMAIGFCNGNKTVKTAYLLYKNTSEYTRCICRVQHTAPNESDYYTVRSNVLKSSSDPEGGFYKLSFINDVENKSFINKTVGEGKLLFTSSQNISTTIRLELSDDLTRPEKLRIRLLNGNKPRKSELNVQCEHVQEENKEGTTSSTSATTSTEETHSSKASTVKTSSDNQTPTSTVGSQVLPSVGDKGSGIIIPIAGGVIGGLVCIAVAIFIIFILHRRNKRKNGGTSSKTSHDNPVYDAPGPDVIYDLANHVTEKSRDLHENDAATTPSDSDYFTLEDNGGNEGYSYVISSNIGHKDGRPSLNKIENREEVDDCYNHTSVAAESRDGPKGDNYVNVAARTREDYDHFKPNTGFTPGPLSNPSDKDEDSYNHPGQIPFQNTDSEDCYNHLGPSSSQPLTEDCYNHIGQNSSQATINPEDCYNHLGPPSSQTSTNNEDCYNHVGQNPAQSTINPADCYNHLGPPSSKCTMDSEDGYSHNGHISPQTMNSEDCYNHLG